MSRGTSIGGGGTPPKRGGWGRGAAHPPPPRGVPAPGWGGHPAENGVVEEGVRPARRLVRECPSACREHSRRGRQHVLLVGRIPPRRERASSSDGVQSERNSAQLGPTRTALPRRIPSSTA